MSFLIVCLSSVAWHPVAQSASANVPEPNACSSLTAKSTSAELTACDVFAGEQGLDLLEAFAGEECTVFGMGDSKTTEGIAGCRNFLEKNKELPYRAHFLAELDKMASAGRTAVTEPEYRGWAVYVDEDLLTPKLNDDRDYTMGLFFAWGGSKFSDKWLGSVRSPLDGWLHSHDPEALETHHSLMLGETAFTPNDLEQEAPIPDDRPYASLTILANQKVSAKDRYATKSVLSVGILGLDIAKKLQRWLHNDVHVSDQDPRGWDNQISDGGEPTALYAVDRMVLLKRNESYFDFSANYGYSVGYYTGVSAGFDVRLGPSIRSKFFEHSVNPMSDQNQMLFMGNRGGDNYGFLSYKATSVVYNVLLQGQFRESAQTFSGDEIERLVHWAGVGWTYQFSQRSKLTYSFNVRSAEYKGPEARWHYWGGLYYTRSLGQ